MVLGNDIAGTVTAIGPEVDGHNDINLKVGDLIFGQSNHIKQTADSPASRNTASSTPTPPLRSPLD